MNWHNLPGIKERETELKKLDLKIIKLKAQYLRSALWRHFPEEMKLNEQ